MRTGAYVIHQSLTAEAATVLKLAVSLARRRGHAQVTPLHVAAILLTTSSASPSPPLGPFAAGVSAFNLLKNACLKSQPSRTGSAIAAHSGLHCRALELCFNVALNRLPTVSAPPPPPTLSNALLAALKRAQANQRRGCIEQQQLKPPPTLPPMQPAASALLLPPHNQPPFLAVKVEVDQLVLSILDDPSVSRVMREAGFSSAAVKSNLEEQTALSIPVAPPPPAPPAVAVHDGGGGFWSSLFLKPPHAEQDLRAVMDVMTRKKKGIKKSNPVIVGDSAAVAEALACELMRKVERGDDGVPGELKNARVIRFHPPATTKGCDGDVEAKVAEMRRSIASGDAVGVVIYLGDLTWAAEMEESSSAAAAGAEQIVEDVGKMVKETSSGSGGVWLVATASYGVYMKSRRKLQLESRWGMQPVLVPTGGGAGLALSLQAAATAPSPSILCSPAATLEQRVSDDGHALCSDFRVNFEKESSSASLPNWPSIHKDGDNRLRQKWSRLCGMVHRNPLFRAAPQWPLVAPLTLALSDSATSEAASTNELAVVAELERLLSENVPWQPDAAAVIKTVGIDRVNRVLMKGSDHVAKRRAALAIAAALCGSPEQMICVSGDAGWRDTVSKKAGEMNADHRRRLVVFVQGVNQIAPDALDEPGWLVIFATGSGSAGERSSSSVIDLRFSVHPKPPLLPQANSCKRKEENIDDPVETKRPRTSGGAATVDFDLNISVEDGSNRREEEEEEEEDAVPSDITQDRPAAATAMISVTLDATKGTRRQATSQVVAKLERAFAEATGGGKLVVGEAAAAELLAGSAWYLEELFDRWVKEAFRPSAAAVKVSAGEKVELGIGVGDLGIVAFHGSALPCRVYVD